MYMYDVHMMPTSFEFRKFSLNFFILTFGYQVVERLMIFVIHSLWCIIIMYVTGYVTKLTLIDWSPTEVR